MTVPELLGAVLGGGTISAVVGAVGTALAGRAKERSDAKKDAATVDVAHVEASATALNLMSALIGEMRGERARLVEETNAARARTEAEAQEKHECLELVGELRGHVDQLEPRLQQIEVALDKCRDDHATAKAELATFKRSVTSELAKRPPSNPGFPKAGG